MSSATTSGSGGGGGCSARGGDMGASDIGDSIKASGEVCETVTSSSGVGVR